MPRVSLTADDLRILQRLGHTLPRNRMKFQHALTGVRDHEHTSAVSELGFASNREARTVKPTLRARWRIRQTHAQGLAGLKSAIY